MKKPRQFGLASILLLAFVTALSGCGGPHRYTLNLTIENGPGCAVEPASGAAFPEGTIVTLTPAFATGYALYYWGGTDGDEVTLENTIEMDGDKNIAAIFAKLQYDLDAVSTDEAAGSVVVRLVPPDRASHSIEHGQAVELIAQPNPGYLFDHWDGGLTGDANPATLTMTGPLTVTAHFTPGIKGRVFWQSSLVGVAGITVNAGGLAATTDAEGRWRIEGVSLPVTVTAAAPADSGYYGAIFSPAVTIYPVSAGDIQIAMISAYKLERVWGGTGSVAGQFRGPYGIAVDAGGNVYVADFFNNRIQKFAADGTYLQWGGLNYPQGVAAAGGYVYVTEEGYDRVLKFTASGGYDSDLGNEGQFWDPEGVAVDAAGNVYVADMMNNRIQKFAANGDYITQWGGFGSGNGQFMYPGGIAVSADGHVYVADSHNHRVQKFAADGAYITQWGDGRFSTPIGIAASADGCVYVGDFGNNLIQEFRPVVGQDSN